jgi:hypothetical protein
MRSERFWWAVRVEILVLFFAVSLVPGCRMSADLESATQILALPRIQPDFTGVTLPSNIAPLNFAVRELGERYHIRIHSLNGGPVEIDSSSPRIQINPRKWRELLSLNRGEMLFFDIYVMDARSNWQRFQTVTNRIAEEEIDSVLAYRVIKPIFSVWRNVGIYQRNLENFDEKVILHGRNFKDGCVNCHTFLNNSPEKMFVGIRSMAYGVSTLYAEKADVHKIGAKWGYTSWHPSGRFATYPIMDVRQFFHAAGMEIRDVIDLDSSMAYYDLDAGTTHLNPGASDKERLESYPSWSPNGRYLYFSSAQIPWEDRTKVPPENFDQAKYDLRRVSYEPATGEWGEPEIILSSEETGMSILEPRISPDGRFLLFCMCAYSVFPVFQPSSDLYLMDLETGSYRRLAINSEFSESWHSWSNNSRWIVFSSKRQGGLFTRPYFSYVDDRGNVSKPFVLPQKNPLYYESFIRTFSVPELVTGPIRIKQKALVRAIRSQDWINVDTFTSATPKGAEPKVPIRE